MPGLVSFLTRASRWLFWPGLMLVTWGELAAPERDLHRYFLFIIPQDKAQHFTAYFGLAAMAAMILGLRLRLGLALLGLIAFSGGLEILQGYTGRDPDIFDLMANSIGVACGWAVAAWLLKSHTRLVEGGPRH